MMDDVVIDDVDSCADRETSLGVIAHVEDRVVRVVRVVEGALFAAGRPLSVKELMALFVVGEHEDQSSLGVPPSIQDVLDALTGLKQDYLGRGIELKQTGSGYRFQVMADLGPWVSRLWAEKPQKYSRALLETLALVAYRQPITRGEIEDVRGVAVSTQIMKTLIERDWVRVVGHKDVPGRPAMYATTKVFLDYFNLASLENLPPLSAIKDLESIAALFQVDDQFPVAAKPDASDESDVVSASDRAVGDSVVSDDPRAELVEPSLS